MTSLLKEAWPGANVELFGSVANGLSVRGTNDLDICMQLPESSDAKVRLRAGLGRKLASMKPKLSGCLSCPWRVVHTLQYLPLQESKVEAALRVAETVREAGMEDVKDLPGARIPVVKFGLPGTALRVDVTIDNDLACANTRYLAAYAAIDPRFRQLVSRSLWQGILPACSYTGMGRWKGVSDGRVGQRRLTGARGFDSSSLHPQTCSSHAYLPSGDHREALGQAAEGERAVHWHPLFLLLCADVCTPAADPVAPNPAGPAAAAPHPHRQHPGLGCGLL